jgi:phage-related minor tail protein
MLLRWRISVSKRADCADKLDGDCAMAEKTTRVLVNRKLADEAMRALGMKSRSEAARIAVKQLLDSSAEIGRQLRRRGLSEEEVLADFAAWRQAKREAGRPAD